MKTLKTIGILCFMLCFTLSTAQGGNNAKKGHHPLPFKAKISYYLPSGNPFNGSGIGTKLGNFTTISYVNQAASTGHDIITAADGSELFMDWDIAYTSPTTVVGNWTFNGGTGRFTDAKGSGTYTGVITPEWNLVLVMTGTITFNGRGDNGDKRDVEKGHRERGHF